MDSLQYQEKVIEDAAKELLAQTGVSYEQLAIIRSYLEYVYTIGHTRGYKDASAYKRRPILQTKRGEIIAKYESTDQAAAITGISAKGINNALRGAANTCGGYFWKYAD